MKFKSGGKPTCEVTLRTFVGQISCTTSFCHSTVIFILLKLVEPPPQLNLILKPRIKAEEFLVKAGLEFMKSPAQLSLISKELPEPIEKPLVGN